MRIRHTIILAILFSSSPLLAADDLLIDPRLVAEAAQVWSYIAAKDNRVWPGWDASDTPILFYLPGRQDVLINHPNPPEGFKPYEGPVRFPGGRIFVRTGDTIIEFDGQNTSRDVGGTTTLVVADTLSNHRMRMANLMDDPRPATEKLPRGDYDLLMEDPYAQMVMIAHEAFHVFQGKAAPNKGGDELALKTYPVLSVPNNVGFALEGAALADAMRAGDDEACRAAAVKFLAVRGDRRGWLTSEAIAYEDGTEFNEGLAKYVEYKLARVLEGEPPYPPMMWVQGFRGLDDLSFFRERLIEMMLKHMRGEVNVNNDPYGTSPLRMRLYFSGMAVAATLDRLSPGWHGEILMPDTTLTGLLAEAVGAGADELELALSEATDGEAFEELLEIKTKLEEDGRKHVLKMVDEILHGRNTHLTVDYSGMNVSNLAMSYSPFGIAGVDEDRTIYRLIPVSVRLKKGYEFSQTEAVPLLHDEKEKQFHFQLLKTVRREDVPSPPWTGGELVLPGVRLVARKASVEWEGNSLKVKLLP